MFKDFHSNLVFNGQNWKPITQQQWDGYSAAQSYDRIYLAARTDNFPQHG